jgi:hypothetical protein
MANEKREGMERPVAEEAAPSENKIGAGTNCVRARAVPIVKKAVFPKTKFNLQADSLTAIETVELDNGDKLIIKNWGCEYYILTFNFETCRFLADTTNVPFWYNKAVLLMSELYNGLDSPINIKEGIGQLMNHIDKDSPNNYKNLAFHDAVDFGNPIIRGHVLLERVEKLAEKRYAIEISFAKGPL